MRRVLLCAIATIAVMPFGVVAPAMAQSDTNARASATADLSNIPVLSISDDTGRHRPPNMNFVSGHDPVVVRAAG